MSIRAFFQKPFRSHTFEKYSIDVSQIVCSILSSQFLTSMSCNVEHIYAKDYNQTNILRLWAQHRHWIICISYLIDYVSTLLDPTADPHGHGQFPVHLHNHCEASQLSPAAVAEALPFRNLKQWTECRITIVHQTSHREWEKQMSSLFCEEREAEGGSSTVQPRFLFWREFWKVVPHTEVMDAFGYRKWNFTCISHSDSAMVPKTTGMMARQEMAHQNT